MITRANRTKKTIAVTLIPAVMLVNVVVQFYNSTQKHTSAWKGGGFGMFSTLDLPRRRLVRCTLITEDKEYIGMLNARAVETAKYLTRFPSPERIVPIASYLAGMRWTIPAETPLPGMRFTASQVSSDVKLDDQTRELAIKAVRISVWSVSFDNDSTQGLLRHINSVEVAR